MTDSTSRPLALVTGASSGIGAAIAARLAATGHDLVLVARREQRLRELAKTLRDTGAACEVLPADLSEPGGIEQVAARLRHEDVSLLVSNAGTPGYRPLVDTDAGDLVANWTLNTTANLALSRAITPSLLEAGSGGIILIASGLAFSGGTGPSTVPGAAPGHGPHRTLYASAKSALVCFGRLLAAEVAGTGVRVRVVCPARTETEWMGGYSGGGVMSATDVATAALASLELDETVCFPGLEDTSAWTELAQAEVAVLRGNGSGHLAQRYR